MIYSKESSIKTTGDVANFFQHLVDDKGVNFHPDTAFEEYISRQSKESLFSKEECAIYNKLMEESFEVCNHQGVDIYQIGCDVLFSRLGINA